MATSNVYGYGPGLVDAPVAAYDIMGGGGVGRTVLSFFVKMKTATPESVPGDGVLLLEMTYFDGETRQSIDLSLSLSAGNYNYGGSNFQSLWVDQSQSVTLEFRYIGPSPNPFGVDGSADVTIDIVDQ